MLLVRSGKYPQGGGVTIVTGRHYLGRYLGDAKLQAQWLEEKVARWADGIRTLEKMARNHLQAAYADLQRSLQLEWAFLQRATQDLDKELYLVETALREEFLPELFLGGGGGHARPENHGVVGQSGGHEQT